MPTAGPVDVVDYRTHLLVIQSNVPKRRKVIELHRPFLYFSQAFAFRHRLPRLLGRPTKIFLYCLLEYGTSFFDKKCA